MYVDNPIDKENAERELRKMRDELPEWELLDTPLQGAQIVFDVITENMMTPSISYDYNGKKTGLVLVVSLMDECDLTFNFEGILSEVENDLYDNEMSKCVELLRQRADIIEAKMKKNDNPPPGRKMIMI